VFSEDWEVSKWLTYPKKKYPRFTREMNNPRSTVPLKRLQRAIDGAKAFGGKLAFERFLKQQKAADQASASVRKRRSIPTMSVTMTNKPKSEKPRKRTGKGIQRVDDGKNPHGVYDCQEIPIYTTPSTKIKVSVRVAHRGGVEPWAAAFSARGPEFGRSSPVTDREDGYATRDEAIGNSANDAAAYLEEQLSDHIGDAKRSSLRKAIETVRRFATTCFVNEPEKKKNPGTNLVPTSSGMFARGIQSGSLSIVNDPPAKLSAMEKKRLEKCEKMIEMSRAIWIDLGSALATIQTDRLYRETHSTFEAYCAERHGISRQHAYRLIDGCKVVRNVSPTGDTKLLESQARELAKIKDPETQREVWEVVNAEASGEECQLAITAKRIQEVVAEKIGEPAKRSEPKSSPVGKSKKTAVQPLEDDLEADSLQDDLAAVEVTLRKLKGEWTTAYQRKEIAAFLRKMATDIEGK
jgi:hypothetical protein